MTPLPHPAQGMGKKADMFEGNVLLKKYRGGRQEEYLKNGFALLWDLPVNICIHVKFKVFISSLMNYLFICLLDHLNVVLNCILRCLKARSFKKTLVVINVVRI